MTTPTPTALINIGYHLDRIKTLVEFAEGNLAEGDLTDVHLNLLRVGDHISEIIDLIVDP